MKGNSKIEPIILLILLIAAAIALGAMAWIKTHPRTNE